MKQLNLYRERIIPKESVLLKDDVILYFKKNILVTSWKALKPKKDLHHGYSIYYLDEGFKISKFYREDHSLLYYYCDIIDYSYDKKENTLVVTDLLADIIIYPDGSYQVIDLGELSEALDLDMLSITRLKKALTTLDNLLTIIYNDKFEKYSSFLETFEN